MIALPDSAGAQERGQLIVVLDGSGSMWGGLEGTHKGKFGFARDALVAAARRNDPEVAIGLITFGARTGGSCQSADALVAPSDGSADAIVEALARFNPQGRGPVVLGLEWARDQVVKSPAGSQILLIHDGDDNCGGNMCQFARAFAQSVPSVKINAISIALKAGDRAGAACVAKETGGRWFEAETADDVAQGLEVILANLAQPGRAPASPAQPPSPAATPRPATPGGNVAVPSAPPARPAEGASVELEAVLKTTRAPLPRGVKWHVRAAGESGDDAFQRSFSQSAVALNLASGRYVVTLETELSREQRTITVRSEQNQKVTFALDGGFLDIKTIGGRSAADGGPAAVATLEALSAKDGDAPVVWSGGIESASGFLVAPGRYRVTIDDGLAKTAETIDLKDGEARALALQAGRGRLEVVVTGLDDKQMASAVVLVAADDPTAPGGRRPIARSAAGQARFHLEPGTYHVTLEVFGDTNTEIVVVPSGELVEQKISLVQMGLTVSSRLGASSKPVRNGVRYRLWQTARLNTPIKVSREVEPTFYLVPGKYRIESRLGQQNAVIVREFEIGRQRYGKLELTHEAGRVAFELGDGGRLGDNNAFWTLTDRNQRLIWRTISASPEMTLKAGLYTVRVASEQKTYAAKFAVVAGHAQTVTLSEE